VLFGVYCLRVQAQQDRCYLATVYASKRSRVGALRCLPSTRPSAAGRVLSGYRIRVQAQQGRFSSVSTVHASKRSKTGLSGYRLRVQAQQGRFSSATTIYASKRSRLGAIWLPSTRPSAAG
jgi:ribosomal protein L34